MVTLSDTLTREKAANLADLSSRNVDGVRRHPGLNGASEPIGIAAIGLLTRGRDHAKMGSVEGLNRNLSGRKSVVDKIDLRADLLRGKELAPLAQLGGQVL